MVIERNIFNPEAFDLALTNSELNDWRKYGLETEDR